MSAVETGGLHDDTPRINSVLADYAGEQPSGADLVSLISEGRRLERELAARTAERDALLSYIEALRRP